ncbi:MULTISPECIES: phage tail protein [Methanobacterium]|uniref:Phage tail tape measure protein domain-containing protein n=1 Tax=Methanobacterium bryantii TaxID=2161 RepID=A0A2A2H8M1_METBR|nr:MULTISPECIES: hypothetical protein [Methanobacterium]OEC87895.1 hypothetical protein A9507_06885 [Methanobacterium sp. A39]PAV05762.1 hypothetical protein ASJ80_08495 [Methanobacterium bryantii]
MSDNQYVIDVSTNADTASVEELAAKLQEVETNAQSAGEAISSMDNSGLDEASTSADNAAESLENADEAANNLSGDLEKVDGAGVEEVSDSASNASDEMDNASTAGEGLSAVATGLASAGIVSTMLSWADTSGNVSSQWSRMALAMKSTGLTAAQVQQTYSPLVTQIAKDTGRSGGQIREFFIQMANSGVTNSEVLKSSFEGIAGAAFVTGRDVNNVGEMFSRFVKSGNIDARRLASQFAMSLPEVGNAMRQLGFDVSDNEEDIKEAFKNMDETTRARVLGTASSIKSGSTANDEYKKSWDGMKQQMDKAQAGLFKFVGDLILPTLIPALKLATDGLNSVTTAFKSAPAPVQQIFGVLGLLGGSFIALVLAISSIRSAWNFLQIGKTVGDLKSLGNAALHPSQTLQTLKTRINGVGPATRVESVKRSFQGLSQSISNAGSTTKKSLTSAGSTITSFASNAGSKIKDVGTAFINSGKSALTAGANYVKSGVMAAASAIKTGILTLATWAQTAAQAALNFVMSLNPITIVVIAIIALIAVLIYLWTTNEGFRNALIGAWTAIAGFFGNIGGVIWGYLVGLVTKFLAFRASIINTIISTFSNVVNTARSYVSRLPGIVWNEMINIGNKIAGAAGYIFSQVQAVFGNIVKWAMQALGIASPGHIARAIGGEMGYVVDGIVSAQSNANAAAKGLGASILSGFGSPSLSVATPTGYGSASLGFDATEINNSLTATSNGNNQRPIVQYINQEGIMSEAEAADRIVKAVKEQLWKENLIAGKSG